MSSVIFVAVLTCFQAFMLQLAYKNIKFVKKDRIATQRTQAITKEIQVQIYIRIIKNTLKFGVILLTNPIHQED